MWEYKVLECKVDVLRERLNKLGEDNWELVSCTLDVDSPYLQWSVSVLKRKLA